MQIYHNCSKTFLYEGFRQNQNLIRTEESKDIGPIFQDLVKLDIIFIILIQVNLIKEWSFLLHVLIQYYKKQLILCHISGVPSIWMAVTVTKNLK